MFRNTLMITTALTALVLVSSIPAAQASWFSDVMNKDVAAVRTMQPTGTDFRAQLAREYRTLALYESDDMWDFPSSDYYAKKALSVNSGAKEIPSVPQVWNIKGPLLDELLSGRGVLVDAFDKNAKVIAPREAAIAQAKYDCWVEQSNEGTANSWQPADIAACKQGFYDAMGLVNAAILAAAPVPKQVAEAPAPTPMPARYVPANVGVVIYFDYDKAVLTSASRQQIDNFVARLGGKANTAVTVAGHTDRSGTVTYNNALSERRAVAVRDELVSRGIVVREFEDLKLTAAGESDPAVATADGVRNAMNRRAVVTAYRLEIPNADSGKVSMIKR
jgi:OOP family OmpA-OmpF porin